MIFYPEGDNAFHGLVTWGPCDDPRDDPETQAVIYVLIDPRDGRRTRGSEAGWLPGRRHAWPR